MAVSPLALEQVDCSAAIKSACQKIPPLWPLQNFVAVNPFLGLSEMPFAEAAEAMQQVMPGGMLMDSHLAKPISTVADWLDEAGPAQWSAFITDEISKVCSVYFDRGQCVWPFPFRHLPLYQAWRAMAQLDANPEVFGLPRFREFAAQLPLTAEESISQSLAVLNIPPEHTVEFLHRQLMTIFGWSAYAAYHDRQPTSDPLLPQVLAIRLAYDAGLLSVAKGWHYQEPSENTAQRIRANVAAQLSLEHAFRQELIDKLNPARLPVEAQRKELQAVFCIDVRSEVLRRALESESPEIETIGFAGFFGMPLEICGSDHCPVLIKPGYQASEPASKSNALANLWKAITKTAASCFPAIEVGGPWFGVKLLQSSFATQPPKPVTPTLTWQIPLSDRVELAAAALKNMSVDISRLARVVLLCGHGSQTENNPYASSLDCGACGGHKGDTNAFFAAALMNDPDVRHGLRELGFVIPADTVFISGIHITSTEDVFLHEAPQVPSAQLAEIQNWLTNASAKARQERNNGVAKDFRKRAADWSEVRPEWGLAGNAAFIAAPRSTTYGINLEGRVFLHEYNADTDPDGSVLNMILTAPVVVASWINLQYYGSVVNNAVLGSGNKVLHNVVGEFGVWEGNGGDLRAGLPLQSLHDGQKWVHEPLRLQVFVQAPLERINSVLRANEHIRNLVRNQWIHLLAIHNSTFHTCHDIGDWR